MATKEGHHYGGKLIPDGAYSDMMANRALPLDAKIERSLAVISCWHEAWDGQVCVSYSGGKDSSVLLWLVRQLFPDVPGLFVNTGLEYPEVVRHVKDTPNVTTLRPAMPFHQVIETYGWPMISKRVARGVNILRNPTGANANIWKLYNEGVNRFGEPVQGFKVPERWRFLVDAPFQVSDLCCNVMKKAPIHRYQKENGGRMPYLGTLAEDSKTREKNYLQHGCNAYDLKHPRSTPLGFWTEQDILECIRRYKINIPEVYGEIIDDGGELRTTGVKGTGCIFCGFGLHLDDRPTRFQRLAETHPKLWEYVMDRLGMREVLAYCAQHAPGNGAWRFDPEPCAPCVAMKQAALPLLAGEGV